MARNARHIIHEIYSDVMFELADDAGLLDEVMSDLEIVAEIFESEPEFLSLLTLGNVKDEEKAEIVRRVFGGRVNGLTLDFLCVLARRNRMQFITGIGQRYESLLDQRRHLHRIELTLPRQPSQEQLDALRAQIEAALGARVKLTFTVNPEILGGVIIRRGDIVIDNSVRTILNRTINAVMTRSREKLLEKKEP